MEINGKESNGNGLSRRPIPNFFKLFMFSVLFISISVAQTCGTFGTYVQNGVCVPDVLLNISNLVMLLSLLIASVLLMFGYALEHRKVISFSKDLLFQLLGTAVILAIYLGLVASLNFWAPALLGSNLSSPGDSPVRSVGGGWNTLQGHSEHYVSCLLDYSKESVKQVLFLTQLMAVVTSSTMTLSVGSFSQYMPIFPTGGGLIPLASMAMGMFAGVIMQLNLQLELLRLWIGLFNVMLPVGLIFRSFPYTRGAGAAMIAITIGFTIFLPIFYLLIEDIGYNYLKKDVCSISPVDFQSLKQILNLIRLGMQSATSDMSSVLENQFSPDGEYGTMIKVLLFQATLLPVVAYLVVLNITKRLAELLGGEIDFSTLVRLI